MQPESAEALLTALGSKKSSQAGIWMRGTCPLAPWLHKSGKDTNPSFGIVVEEGTPPRFHCFTCESGSLQHLLQTIEYHNHLTPGRFHGDLHKARVIVDNAELELPILPGYSEFTATQKKQFNEWPSYFLETFKPVHMHVRSSDYCYHRGFTESECQHFDLRYDPERDMLLFPYWDVFGRFAGIRGRKVRFPHEEAYGNQHHDYTWNGSNNAHMTLYNEQVLNLPGPAVVVEGQVDCIKVQRVWKKTVANLTAKPVADKMGKLGQAEGVVLLLDGDQPGRDATKKWLDLLLFLNVKVFPVYLPFDEHTGVKTDPDSVGEHWLRETFTAIGLLS